VNQLSNDTVLYRAITKKGWLNPDTKVIDLEAFKLQFKRKIGDYENSLSAALNPEDSYNRLSQCFGVICFTVGDIRKLGLDAILDKPDHVSIHHLPHPETNEKEAIDIAGKLARKAWLLYDWLDKPYKKQQQK
jgi:hypothetical protein